MTSKYCQGLSLLSFSIVCFMSIIVLSVMVDTLVMMQKSTLKLETKMTDQQDLMLGATTLLHAIDQSSVFFCRTPILYQQMQFLVPDLTLSAVINQNAIEIYSHQSHYPSLLGLTKKGSGQWVAGSDSLKVETLKQSLSLSTPLLKGSQAVYLNARPRWKLGQLVLVDNCQSLAVFRLIRVQRRRGGGTLLTLDRKSPFHFGVESSISLLTVTVFYIGKTTRKRADGIRILALYEKKLLGRRQEVVPNINQLVIKALSVTPSIFSVALQGATTENSWQIMVPRYAASL